MRIFLLILLFPCYGMSQSDSTLVANSTLIKIGQTLQSQNDSLIKQRLIIDELMVRDSLQSTFIFKQSREIENLDKQLDIANDITGDYQAHLKKDRSVKNSRLFYFIAGIATTYITSLIIKNTN